MKKISSQAPELRKKLKNTEVIYTDLDKTLLGPRGSLFLNDKEELTTVTAESLVALIKFGVDIVIISGRTTSQLREISRLLGLKSFIAEMGCLLSYYIDGREEILRGYSFTHEPTISLYEAIERCGAPKLLLSTYNDRLEYHTPWSKGRQCTHLFRGSLDVAAANIMLVEKGFRALKLIDNGIVNTKGSLAHLGEVHAYHLLPTEVSKASAIFHDRARRGLAAKNVIAIGDSITDAGMSAAVNSFFIVGDTFTNSDLVAAGITDNNIYLSEKKMGPGWAEVADLILES